MNRAPSDALFSASTGAPMTATAKELVTQRGEMGFGSGMLVLMAMVWLPALEDLVWVFDTGAVRENPSG